MQKTGRKIAQSKGKGKVVGKPAQHIPVGYVEGKGNTVKEWLIAADGKTPLDVLESAIDKVQFVVSYLDIVSLEETMEQLETLLAAMQIAAGKKAEFEPTAEEVERALEDLCFLESEGIFRGLGESIDEATDVVYEWQNRCEDSESEDG